jgi:hypothetical protein
VPFGDRVVHGERARISAAIGENQQHVRRMRVEQLIAELNASAVERIGLPVMGALT